MRGHRSMGAVVAVVVILAIPPVFVEASRPLWAVVFCLLLPGSGWAYRAEVGDFFDKVALAVIVSMCATILVATGMVVTNSWSVLGGVAGLAVFALLGFVPFARTPSRSFQKKGIHLGADSGDAG